MFVGMRAKCLIARLELQFVKVAFALLDARLVTSDRVSPMDAYVNEPQHIGIDHAMGSGRDHAPAFPPARPQQLKVAMLR